MSSPPPPQLQLDIPSNSTSFKRSFGQLGIDIEDGPSQDNHNENGNDREAKRARSASVVGDGINDPSSSDEERMGPSLAGPSSDRESSGDSMRPSVFAPHAMVARDENNGSMDASHSRPLAHSHLGSARSTDTPPRLPTPPVLDVDIPVAGDDAIAPFGPPLPALPTSPTTIPTPPDQGNSYASTLERYRAFNDALSILRGAPEPHVRPSSPPPTLPPLALPIDEPLTSTSEPPPRVDLPTSDWPALRESEIGSFHSHLSSALDFLRQEEPGTSTSGEASDGSRRSAQERRPSQPNHEVLRHEPIRVVSRQRRPIDGLSRNRRIDERPPTLPLPRLSEPPSLPLPQLSEGSRESFMRDYEELLRRYGVSRGEETREPARTQPHDGGALDPMGPTPRRRPEDGELSEPPFVTDTHVPRFDFPDRRGPSGPAGSRSSLNFERASPPELGSRYHDRVTDTWGAMAPSRPPVGSPLARENVSRYTDGNSEPRRTDVDRRTSTLSSRYDVPDQSHIENRIRAIERRQRSLQGNTSFGDDWTGTLSGSGSSSNAMRDSRPREPAAMHGTESEDSRIGTNTTDQVSNPFLRAGRDAVSLALPSYDRLHPTARAPAQQPAGPARVSGVSSRPNAIDFSSSVPEDANERLRHFRRPILMGLLDDTTSGHAKSSTSSAVSESAASAALATAGSASHAPSSSRTNGSEGDEGHSVLTRTMDARREERRNRWLQQMLFPESSSDEPHRPSAQPPRSPPWLELFRASPLRPSNAGHAHLTSQFSAHPERGSSSSAHSAAPVADRRGHRDLRLPPLPPYLSSSPPLPTPDLGHPFEPEVPGSIHRSSATGVARDDVPNSTSNVDTSFDAPMTGVETISRDSDVTMGDETRERDDERLRLLQALPSFDSVNAAVGREASRTHSGPDARSLWPSSDDDGPATLLRSGGFPRRNTRPLASNSHPEENWRPRLMPAHWGSAHPRPPTEVRRQSDAFRNLRSGSFFAHEPRPRASGASRDAGHQPLYNDDRVQMMRRLAGEGVSAAERERAARSFNPQDFAPGPFRSTMQRLADHTMQRAEADRRRRQPISANATGRSASTSRAPTGGLSTSTRPLSIPPVDTQGGEDVLLQRALLESFATSRRRRGEGEVSARDESNDDRVSSTTNRDYVETSYLNALESLGHPPPGYTMVPPPMIPPPSLDPPVRGTGSHSNLDGRPLFPGRRNALPMPRLDPPPIIGLAAPPSTTRPLRDYPHPGRRDDADMHEHLARRGRLYAARLDREPVAVSVPPTTGQARGSTTAVDPLRSDGSNSERSRQLVDIFRRGRDRDRESEEMRGSTSTRRLRRAMFEGSSRTLSEFISMPEADVAPNAFAELLRLESYGGPRSRGTPQRAIEALETAKYKDWKTEDSDVHCPICLDDYNPEDPVTKLSGCRHWLHKDCLHQWLRTANTCPVCRQPLRNVRTSGAETEQPFREIEVRDWSRREDRARSLAQHEARLRQLRDVQSRREELVRTRIRTIEEATTQLSALEANAGLASDSGPSLSMRQDERPDPSLPASISRRLPERPPSPAAPASSLNDGLDEFIVPPLFDTSDGWLDDIYPLPVGIEVPTSASAVRGSPHSWRDQPHPEPGSALATALAGVNRLAARINPSASTSTEDAAPTTSNAASASTEAIDPASTTLAASSGSGSGTAPANPASGSAWHPEGTNAARQGAEEVPAMAEDTGIQTEATMQTEPDVQGEAEGGWSRIYRRWYG